VSVVLGWRRASLLALARAGRGARVLAGPDEERREADHAPLERLGVSLELRRTLRALGIDTVGRLRALPGGGVRKRLGEEAAALHDFVCGRTWAPLRPRIPCAPVRAEIPVDPPDDDRTRLLFAIKGALHGLVRTLRSRSEGIRALEIGLRLDHAPAHEERIETAAPTLDVARLIDLVRLRLSSAELAAPVELVEIDVESRPVRPAQIAVLGGPPRRDPATAMAALARVKAALGAASVARARLVDAHLPEARFRWEPVAEIAPPRPAEPGGPLPLVRALLTAPRPLPDPPRHERERWLGRHGAVVAMHGPDRVAAGWWSRPMHRDYFLIETRTGEILWAFLDRAERAWYLHGSVD
jgi:protein ImuB